MATKHPIELFMPPNMLKAKVGSTVGGIDVAAILRAEKAMDTLKSGFTDWFAADVVRLNVCRDAFAAKADARSRADLLRASHDIKGQAATFEFPLVARVASSLCRLIEALSAANAISLVMVDAHVTAIRVIFRDRITDTSNRMALELIQELEARVNEITEAAAA
jgi:HPt (histidine-containing phosphotransfer) domain-containing protein